MRKSPLKKFRLHNSFKKEFARYKVANPKRETKFVLFPQLEDKTAETGFDPHYTYQGPWVMRNLLLNKPKNHVDIGSWVTYLGFFSALQPTEFVDIRPAELDIPGLRPKKGTVLDLPYAPMSIASISCLHVIEHVGLGRYGDPLDPGGTERAASELARVVSKNGDLYVSLPVGKEVTYFNAHRVTDPERVLEMFQGLDLVSFSVVLDDGKYRENVLPSLAKEQNYACGLYHFRRST